MLEQSIVRIWQNGAVVGRGVVVGAREILTCAHIIDNTHPQKRPADDITFDFPLRLYGWPRGSKTKGTQIIYPKKRNRKGEL